MISTGFIDYVSKGKAWGKFTTGPFAGYTLELPCLYCDENGEFLVSIGDKVLKGGIENDSWTVMKDNAALVFQATASTEKISNISRFVILRMPPAFPSNEAATKDASP